MKALTAAEMREVDRLTTERFGISGVQLMENAGKSVAEFLHETLGDDACMSAMVLCGKGNNGGDGFVVARLLQERGLQPLVCIFSSVDAVKGDAAVVLGQLRDSGVEIRVISDSGAWKSLRAQFEKTNVVVDALLGTGLKGAAEALFAEAINDINALSRNCTSLKPQMILAVDTPSGLPSDGQAADGPVLYAHATITFTSPKIGQLVSAEADRCGRLHVKEIGSPSELVEEIGKGNVRWLEPQEFGEMPLVRKADSNKGNYGHVLLVAGSRGKTGAAVLAGRGVLRAGAGLLTIAAPESEQHVVASAQAEWMTYPLSAEGIGSTAETDVDAPHWQEVVKGKTVLAIGPGIGTEESTQQFVRKLVRKSKLPVVLDADGLNAFEGHGSDLRERDSEFLVITPHPGEMARLVGKKTAEVQADRLGVAMNCAKEWNAHIVLKGFHTIVASPGGRVFVNTTGNPGMAKGGSGDVLAGIVAGMIAQFSSTHPAEAVALAVYLHGLAADDAVSDSQEASLLAGEIAEQLPATYRRFMKELQKGV